MLHCNRCDADVNPSHELEGGRVVPVCPTCTSALHDPDAVVAPKSQPPKVAAPVAVLSEDVDLIAAMRAQLVVLDAEIAVLAKRQAYAERLRRMIAASEDATTSEST